MWPTSRHVLEEVVTVTVIAACLSEMGAIASTDVEPMLPSLGSAGNFFELVDDGLDFQLEFASQPHDEAAQHKLSQTLAEQYQPDPVPVSSVTGESYQCYSPKDEHRKIEAASDESSSQKHPSELIKPLKSQCIYRLEMYWSYEYCHLKRVRQYHEDVITSKNGLKTKKVSEHILGIASATGSIIHSSSDKNPTFMYRGVETPYYSEMLTGGDTCDLTGKPRRTEFRFICDPKTRHSFESISETETCAYLAIIHTNLLCDHPDYTEKSTVPKNVLCVSSNTEVIEEARPSRLVEMENSLASEEAQREVEFQKMQEILKAQAAKNAKSKKKKNTFTVKIGDTSGVGGTNVGDASSQETKETTLPSQKQNANPNTAKQMLSLFLEGKQCFLGGQGWWQHEFCYRKHVKQIHREPDGTTQEILLGIWDADYHKSKLQKSVIKKSDKSVTLYYKDGDFCEETKSNRKTKVKIICSKSLRGSQVALSLQETKTCSYTMKVESPLFCEAIKNADDFGALTID